MQNDHAKPTGPALRARLHAVTLETPDPVVLARFYTRVLGFQFSGPAELLSGIARERRVNLKQGVAKRLANATYRLDDSEALTALTKRVKDAGVKVSESAQRGQGESIDLLDPDGNSLSFVVAEVAPAQTGFAGVADRSARLQHLVMASSNAPRLIDFYRDTLGFTVSDIVTDDAGDMRTAFLACSSEHHSFAVFAAAECRFDHICFETQGWDAIRDWADHFAAQELTLKWGPGRHGPGNNLFIFIHDPDGNWLELSAELEILSPGRPMGTWRHEQRTLNQWGVGYLRS